MKELKPALITGPKDIIKHYLESDGWNQEDVAEITDVSVKTIRMLITHTKNIFVEMEKMLSIAFNTNLEFWLNLAHKIAHILLHVKEGTPCVILNIVQKGSCERYQKPLLLSYIMTISM